MSHAAVTVGSAAPDFALQTAAGGIVALSSFQGRRCVVVVFLRGFE